MSSSITEKNYTKLTILVSLNGVSFCCFDTISGKPSILKSIHFDTFLKSSKVEDLFDSVYKNNPELDAKYDEVKIIHSNMLSTFVPVALFDEEFIGSYLQYNSKVFETDFFTHDSIEKYEMNNVYIPYVNMNNFFIDKYGTFEYHHANSILVSKLLDLSKNNDERKMFVHVTENHFEIIVVQNQKLHLFNSFEYKTAEDFIYYILFTAEQLQLNPEHFKLEFLGNITEFDAFYQIAYKYIRNVSLFDVSNYDNNFSEKRKSRTFYTTTFMRIISGKYKARRINAPRNLPVRPTTDMSKEALFNVLNNHFNFSELKVLDLFAGTGNISYEFGSRGCNDITCIDGDMGCVNFIKKTAKEFDINITVIKSDVFSFLEKHKASYDIIFADPPYGMLQKDFEKLIALIFEKKLLDEEGMFIVEHSKHTKLDHMMHFSFQKNYGGSVFSFYEFEVDDEEDGS